jgi:hypothetical protein
MVVPGLTGVPNKPTEAMNLLVKKIKGRGHGFRSLANYRLRVLLHCGEIQRNAHPATAMRAHSPQLVAKPVVAIPRWSPSARDQRT